MTLPLQPPRDPTQPPAEELSLGIAALSHATGLPIETLRTWERRYGFPTPRHKEGTLRLYPYATVDHLKKIREALDSGHRPSHVVALPLADLLRLLDSEQTPPAEPEPPANLPAPPRPRPPLHRHIPSELPAWLAATADLDSPTLDNLLRRAWNLHGSMPFLTELAGPYLVEVGERWASGELSVGHEHFATERLRTFLVGEWAEMAADRPVGQVVCATLPGEQHVLGLHMAACVLALTGLRVMFLGAEVPLIDLARVVQQKRPGQPAVRGLLISISQAQEEMAVRRQLAQLRRLVPPDLALLVGGTGAPSDVLGTQHLANFAELSQWAALEPAE